MCATIVLMIVAFLLIVGLCLGSFVNALVWRLHEQEAGKEKHSKEYAGRLSIRKGRSMCPHCKHELSAKDLVPIVSWLSLRGKCRYCGKRISAQYPLVEAATALLFVGSYAWWPRPFDASEVVVFGLWLILLTGLMALLVYDLRWYLLPNRIVFPIGAIAALRAAVIIATADSPFKAFVNVVLAVLISGGIFYVLFQFSRGKWIGGGDVKLGAVLGLIVAGAGEGFLLLFVASLLGSLVSVPLLATKRLSRSSVIPFGPFLIVAAVIVVLFGSEVLNWYRDTFIQF